MKVVDDDDDDETTHQRRGVARILHWGPQKLSERGVPLPNRLQSGERRELPSGVRGGTPSVLGIFEAHRTLLVNKTVLGYFTSQRSQFFPLKNSLNRRLGEPSSMPPPAPPGYAPVSTYTAVSASRRCTQQSWE